MQGRDRRSDGEYGFARGLSADGETEAGPSVRLVHSQEEVDLASKPLAAGLRPPEGKAASTVIEPDDDHWVVRPRADDVVKTGLNTVGTGRRGFHTFGVAEGDEEASAASSGVDHQRKRRFALALAGLVYVVGIAGLWSMAQNFEDAWALPVTPAGDEGPVMPPLDTTIELRDARLDGFIRPKFKPDDLRKTGGDIANSGFQKKI